MRNLFFWDTKAHHWLISVVLKEIDAFTFRGLDVQG
jgi:hypothetical protein